MYVEANLTGVPETNAATVPVGWGYETDDTVAEVSVISYWDGNFKLRYFDTIQCTCFDGNVTLRVGFNSGGQNVFVIS